jgi:DNA-binding transcriptional LysR family regulator
MDLRHLRTFAAVARTGSFTAAAAELGFTQSAVSQHVAALETDVGRRLLTRRPVRLTPDGERLAAHARHILLRVDVARTELGPRHAPPQRFRVVATPLAIGPRVAAGLARLRAADPRSAVDLAVTSADDALGRVADGTADAALVDGVTTPNAPLEAAEPGTLARRLVAEEPVVVLVPADHPLARRTGVALDTLRDALWVDAPRLRCGPPPLTTAPAGRVGYDGTDVAALTLLVAHGHGVALLPAGLATAREDVVAVPVRDPLVHRVELLLVPGRAAATAPLVEALTG